jgi:hypothetical protein
MDHGNLHEGPRDGNNGYATEVIEDPFDVSFLGGYLRERAAKLVESCRVDGVECDFGKLVLVLASRGRVDSRTWAFSQHLRGKDRRRLEDTVHAFAYAAARWAIEEAEIDRLAHADGWKSYAA